MHPLVTIYTVHTGKSQFLTEALESVKKLEFSNVEFILIDDQMDNDCHEIFSSIFRNHDLVSAHIVQNRGVGLISGCRSALEIAQGDWILRLDSDDILHEDAINKMYEFALKNELDLVFPDYEEIDASGEGLRVVRGDLEAAIVSEHEFHGACCLIKREFLLRIGAYRTNADRQDGFEVLLKAKLADGKIGHISCVLFQYRRHGNNISTDELRLSKARNTILCELLKLDKINDKSSCLILPFRNLPRDSYAIAEPEDESSILEKVLRDMSVSTGFNQLALVVQNVSREVSKLAVKYDADLMTVPEFPSITESINFLKRNKKIKSEIVITGTVDYPLRLPEIYDAALSKMLIFKYNEIFSTVRFDSNAYRLGINGLEPISPHRELRLSRDRIYIQTGGLRGLDLNTSEQNHNRRCGQILISSIESLEIREYNSMQYLKSTMKLGSSNEF
jgi:glycosyltransferase involved in cell wall biosynthesis